MRVRIGIVGAGRWALAHHLPALCTDPRVRVTAVADPEPTKADYARRQFNLDAAFADATGLYDSGLVDGVVIATPHVTHYRLAREALDRGLPVLLEKPMTLDPAQAWDLVDRAERAGLAFVVGYPFHFAAHVAKARAYVRTEVGDLSLVSLLYTSPRAHLYRPHPGPPRPGTPDPGTYDDPAVAGGGQGQTEATHAIAALLHTTGLRVERVSARMARHGYPVDVVDSILLAFDGGAVGTLATIGVVSLDHPVQREFRYYGGDGYLLHDLATGELRGHGRSGVIAAAPAGDPYPTGAPARCLVDLMTGADDNPATARLGAQVVSCLAAAYRSAGLGGQPVDVYVPEQSPRQPVPIT